MGDVFISYKREEADKAKLLADTLEQFGFSVWWDSALLSGDEFRGVIQEMIDKSTIVIVLWSPLAVKSKFVVDEATHAQRTNKLLPVFLKECDLPFGFGSQHADDLSTWDGHIGHKGFARLLQSVEKATKKKSRVGSGYGSSDAQRAEMTAFQSAAKLNSRPTWEQFLKDYPGTTFRKFIKLKMKEDAKQQASEDHESAQQAEGDNGKLAKAQKTGFEKHKTLALGLGGAAVIAVIGGAVFWPKPTAPERDIPFIVISPENETLTEVQITALYEDGMALYEGEKFSQAASKFETAAELRNAKARFMLASMYSEGIGVDPSEENAAELYSKAANQGHVQAQVKLAVMYGDGRGVLQSDSQSRKWFIKAANQGSVEAQLNLGYMYEEGKGGSASIPKAIEWFQKAADQGDEIAQDEVARLKSIP